MVGIVLVVIAIAVTAIVLTAPRKDASGVAGDLEESLKSNQLRAVMLLALVGGTTFISGFAVRDVIGRLAGQWSGQPRKPSPGEGNRGN